MMDDIYTAAGGTTGGNSMETKSVPGYVPSPVVLPDFVAPETDESTDSKDSGNDSNESTDTGSKSGAKSSTGKTTTQK